MSKDHSNLLAIRKYKLLIEVCMYVFKLYCFILSNAHTYIGAFITYFCKHYGYTITNFIYDKGKGKYKILLNNEDINPKKIKYRLNTKVPKVLELNSLF